MGKRNKDVLKMQEVQERVAEVISIIMILETDMSAECSDGVYYRVVRVIHRILSEAQQAVEDLVKGAKEGTE